MALGLIRKSTLAIKAESTYGVLPTTFASTDVVSLAGVPNFNSNYDAIENPLLRDTLSKWSTVRGAENVSGDITLPFKGSGTAGTPPDSDALWLASIGSKTTTGASTTTTGSTAASVVLTTGGVAAMGIVVGDAILIDPLGGTAYEAAWVTAIATDTLTVSPSLSSAPATGRNVMAGVHYKLASTRPSFAAKFWRGDITREDYTGLVAESFEVDFATGQVPLPKLTFQGKSMANPVTQTYLVAGYGAATLDTTDFLVARNMTVKIGGVTYKMSNISLSINYDIYKQQAVTSSGTQDIQQTARSVTGSFSLLYEDKVAEDAMRNDTLAECNIMIGDTLGNICALRLPKIRFLETPKSEESGIFKYDVSFGADPTNGEDEITTISWF